MAIALAVINRLDGPLRAVGQIARFAHGRTLLWLYVATAVVPIWIADRPPLVDLPQHAAQVALMLDILHGKSAWANVVDFNFFTPYLIGYGLSAVAAHFVPVVVALKLVLTLAVVAFFAVAVVLRRKLGAPAILDWLILPGFFGFAFKWGFFTFLVAAPVALLFVLRALIFAERPSGRNFAILIILGVVLFFSHGLMFVFGVGIGGCFALAHSTGALRTASLKLAPYGVLALLALGYYFAANASQYNSGLANTPIEWDFDWHRPFAFFSFQWRGPDPAVVRGNLPYLTCFALFYLSPLLLGLRFAPTRCNVIPFATVTMIGLFGPNAAMATAFLYQRFAIFELPLYIMMFSTSRGLKIPMPAAVKYGTLLAVPALCFGLNAVRSWSFYEFDRESADFNVIVNAIPPNQRVLSLVIDKYSPAAGNSVAYMHFGAWYQAEKHGLVDVNFAQFLPQVVRFKPNTHWIRTPFEWEPQQFDWSAHHGNLFDYFIVRSPTQLPSDFFAAPCRVDAVASAGEWTAYRKSRACE